MLRIKSRVWLLGLCLLLPGCYDSRVDRLRLDLLEERLTALENWQQALNVNIIALHGLVDALKSDKFIMSVTETAEGYTLVLNDDSALYVNHGRRGVDGVDGSVVIPVVSVRDSSDGHTYWTVDGALLRNDAGLAVRTDGEKGDPGIPGDPGVPGITPRLRINPDTNEWEVSMDSGRNWTLMGIKATGNKGDKGETGETGDVGPEGPAGPQGDAIFAKDGVDVQEDYVEFTLADGTKFRVPHYREWALHFAGGTVIEVKGMQEAIPFTLSGQGGTPVVDAAGDNGWLAEVRMDAGKTDSGKIIVTVPATFESGSVFVFLSDGVGGCWTYRLTLTVWQPGL